MKSFFLFLTFGKNKVRFCSIYMQALLKSFLSSCFPDRCDSIIGGKYMIKHIVFEEICFLSLRDLQDNYLSALEWWEESFDYCIMTPMADLSLFPLFIFFPHLYSQTSAKMSRSGVTLQRHTCNSTSVGWLHLRVCLCYSSLWPAPLSNFSRLDENLHSEITSRHISCAPNMSRPKRLGAFVTSSSHTGVSQTAGSLCEFGSLRETETEFLAARMRWR